MRHSIPAEPATDPEPPDPAAALGAHLPALRGALRQQRRFRTEQLADLRSAPPGDPAQQEVTETLRRGARVALAGIEAALTRIDAGTYGRCVDCGATIALERLEILPAVSQCTACQRAADGG